MKSMLKKEYEIAHGIVASGRWISRDSRYTEHELEMMITEALNAFANAKLEEAIKIVFKHSEGKWGASAIIGEIRALKHSAQTEGKNNLLT